MSFPNGNDVASYQSPTPPTTGREFGIVKATQSTNYVNNRHVSQVLTYRDAGLLVGHYHFLVRSNPLSQAAYFLDHAGVRPGEFLVCDWETNTANGTHPTNAEKDAFLAKVMQLAPHNRVLLYCNLAFWTGIDTTSKCGHGLWIADPSAADGHPRIRHTWVLHQTGISGGMDTNIANFASKADMATWLGGQHVPAPPVPSQPVVDLSHLVYAAKHDPQAAQGHTTYRSDVKPVENALRLEGLLSSKYAADGSFGSSTITAYKAWQHRCGYSGAAADGIPGMTSLKKLGGRHGFSTKA